mgnify:CR=1 FL=1|tara:strand:- start:132 stop:617 length:486 start_codon:yes stop_codon:yes gene_type:complete
MATGLTPEARGGAHVPDGVQRAPRVFGSGANQHTEMSELPGTPGTELPALMEPSINEQGRALKGLSGLNKFAPGTGEEDLFGKSTNDDVITSGMATGAGVGEEALIKGPKDMSDDQMLKEAYRHYGLMQRLSQIGDSSTQTQAIIRRLQGNAPISPYQMPI